HRLAVLLPVLGVLAGKAHPLELEIAIVQPAEGFTGLNRVAGSLRGLADEALHRRRDRSLHLPFDRRIGRDAEAAAREAEKERDGERRRGGELESRMAPADELGPQGVQAIVGVQADVALAGELEADDRAANRRHRLAQLERGLVEVPAGGA